MCGSTVNDSGSAVQAGVCGSVQLMTVAVQCRVGVCGSTVNDSGSTVQVGVCGSVQIMTVAVQ